MLEQDRTHTKKTCEWYKLTVLVYRTHREKDIQGALKNSWKRENSEMYNVEDAAGDDNREAGLAEQTEVQCFTGGIKGKKKTRTSVFGFLQGRNLQVMLNVQKQHFNCI